jgi:hypothetical protein
MLKALKYNFIIAVLLISLAENSYSCELDNLEFGSTAKQLQIKYKFQQELLEDDYQEVSIRAKSFCKDYKSGKVIFSFFEDKLVRVSIDLESPKIELFQPIKKAFGEPTAKPNFNKIKDKVFATLIKNKNFIVTYRYQNSGDIVFETVNISPVEPNEKLLKYLTKQELEKDDDSSTSKDIRE